MSHLRFVSVALSAGLACLVSPVVSRAQAIDPTRASTNTATARERFGRALALLREGDPGAALAEFEQAYAISRNPQVLFNIAAVHEQLNHYVEALAALREFELHAAPPAVARRAAEIAEARARLESRIGTVVIAVATPGLTLRVDRLEQPIEPARAGLRLSAGRHRIELAAPHHVPRETEIDVAGGARVEIREGLTRTQSTIGVDSNVIGAEIRIDGRIAGTTPLESALPVSEGLHAVDVASPGYTPYHTDVDASGVGARVRAQLGWADPMPSHVAAHLVVRTNEPGGYALLDGRRIAMDGRDALPPGRHVLRIERPDFLPVEQSISLPAGQSTPLDVQLAPTMAFRTRYVAGAESSRTTWRFVGGVGSLLVVAGGIWLALSVGPFSSATNDFNNAVEGIAACRRDACPMEQSMTLLAQQTAAEMQRTSLLGPVIAAASITGVGIIAVVAALVVRSRAPAVDRFDRPPVWRIGAGPRGVSFVMAF